MRRTVGWIMVIVAGLIILYNVMQHRENTRQVNEHPFVTLLSGGENLKGAYTFAPPYTGFEVTVMAVGAIGVILILVGNSRPPT